MGASYGDFTKYPRTPHLFGSRGTADDKHLGESESNNFIKNESLIVEEKIDGTNVGVHFSDSGEMILQCRGHLISEGMHPQYDLFKQWCAVKRNVIEERLANRYLMFGEWVYARHSIHYRRLPHYFFEFDIFDKINQVFLDLKTRLTILDGTRIQTVPVIHQGKATQAQMKKMVVASRFDAYFNNPLTQSPDNLMEGLYLRTEQNGIVTGRAKLVRPEFVEKIKRSEHWQYQSMVPNLLAENTDIWS